jgi:hypothetical protein
MWLLKSFGTHASLVLDTAKAKLNGMPILLAKVHWNFGLRA